MNMVESVDSREEHAIYTKVVLYQDLGRWMIAMQEVMKLLHTNDKWDSVKLTKKKRTVHCK